MRLYHGTSLEIAEIALKHGLRPRGENASNWPDFPSQHDAVYLTTCYAPFFSFQAAHDGKCALIEVEVDQRDERLRPDEDFLAQTDLHTSASMLREFGERKGSIPTDHIKRVCWYRDNIESFQRLAYMSLLKLGTCAFAGIIEPKMFTRVVSFDVKDTPMALAVDHSISLMNFLIMERYYVELTKWFFGDKVDEALLQAFGLRQNIIDRYTCVSLL